MEIQWGQLKKSIDILNWLFQKNIETPLLSISMEISRGKKVETKKLKIPGGVIIKLTGSPGGSTSIKMISSTRGYNSFLEKPNIRSKEMIESWAAGQYAEN